MFRSQRSVTKRSFSTIVCSPHQPIGCTGIADTKMTKEAPSSLINYAYVMHKHMPRISHAKSVLARVKRREK